MDPMGNKTSHILRVFIPAKYIIKNMGMVYDSPQQLLVLKRRKLGNGTVVKIVMEWIIPLFSTLSTSKQLWLAEKT